MEKINYKQLLSTEQYNLLSYYATQIYSNNTDKSYISGIQAACYIASIPDYIMYQVDINNNITGLRNYNRLSYILLFE